MGYYEVFFAAPDYLAKFWVSLLLAVGAILGQMVISCMGGFAFAFYDFPGKRLLYGLLCLFMLIPLQVTLLPNYLLLDQLGALNTYWALLLPLAFAPLGTFLLTQIFRSVPADILHAARLDGAGTLQVLARVLLPCGKSGVSTLIILDTDRKLEHGGAAPGLSARRGLLPLVRVPGKPIHGEPALPVCVQRALPASPGVVLPLFWR